MLFEGNELYQTFQRILEERDLKIQELIGKEQQHQKTIDEVKPTAADTLPKAYQDNKDANKFENEAMKLQQALAKFEGQQQ